MSKGGGLTVSRVGELRAQCSYGAIKWLLSSLSLQHSSTPSLSVFLLEMITLFGALIKNAWNLNCAKVLTSMRHVMWGRWRSPQWAQSVNRHFYWGPATSDKRLAGRQTERQTDKGRQMQRRRCQMSKFFEIEFLLLLFLLLLLLAHSKNSWAKLWSSFSMRMRLRLPNVNRIEQWNVNIRQENAEYTQRKK